MICRLGSQQRWKVVATMPRERRTERDMSPLPIVDIATAKELREVIRRYDRQRCVSGHVRDAAIVVGCEQVLDRKSVV